MWTWLSSRILRHRVPILIALGIITVLMALSARNVEMSYKFSGLLPQDDPTALEFKRFQEQFSEDGNILVIGVNDESLWELDNFREWYALGEDLKKTSVPKDTLIDGKKLELQLSAIDSVFSVAHTYELKKDTANTRFEFEKIVPFNPTSQAEVDAIKDKIYSLPFYEGLLYNKESHSTLMMVFVNAPLFNSADRGPSVSKIIKRLEKFKERTGLETHISGLPYIRTEMSAMLKKELGLFIFLAAFITATLIAMFFKNFRVVIVCLIVVAVGVIWSLGVIALLGFPITMLMSLIPPLMIVIGIPNCVYLVNKYHAEYKRHGKQGRALARVIQKVGNATFMTNTTTALGFATFTFTHSDILRQFGIVAPLNILGVFILSILITPILFSYMAPPKRKHVKHLERKWVFVVVDKLVYILQHKRKWVYIGSALVLVLSLLGIRQVQTTGKIVDDLPQEQQVMTDLRYFEKEVNGIMPFEVLVDLRRPGQITKPNVLRKIEEIQEVLEGHPEFSKSLSIADAVKFARQAFYNGDSSRYALLTRNEQSFIGPYFSSGYNTGGIEQSFMDSARSQTRITVQVADVGTIRMEELVDTLHKQMDEIFRTDTLRTQEDIEKAKKRYSEAALTYQDDGSALLKKVGISFTGSSVTYVKGTSYMVKNLFISLAIAIFLIALLMAVLFRSARMVLISLLPNMIPLLVTAGVMGFTGISIKPSTILVFSIAFGISVDDTIHFLAKYRQELTMLDWNIREAVYASVRETGVSMMYTSIILFFGFGIFVLSEFDGTKALGVLVSMTLLVAMLANLLLLPSLLLSLDKSITTKTFKEPLLEIIDEEDDIETDDLEVVPGLNIPDTP